MRWLSIESWNLIAVRSTPGIGFVHRCASCRPFAMTSVPLTGGRFDIGPVAVKHLALGCATQVDKDDVFAHDESGIW